MENVVYNNTADIVELNKLVNSDAKSRHALL